MNCSFCAWPVAAIPSNAAPSRADFKCFMVSSYKGNLIGSNPDRIGETRPGVNDPAQQNTRLQRHARRRPWCIATSMWKRPQAQLLLADLPEPGEAVRLDDQEEDDKVPEYTNIGLGTDP